MSEYKEQAKFFEWVRAKRIDDSRYKHIYAVDAGVKLAGTKQQQINKRNRLHAQGVEKGTLDIQIMWPIRLEEEGFLFPGAFIEMKWGKNKTTKEQKIWLDRHREAGYICAVAYNFQEARQFVLNYFNYDRY
jgi:hypothetical protein